MEVVGLVGFGVWCYFKQREAMTAILEIIASFFTHLAEWLRERASGGRNRSLTGEREAEALISPWVWLVILVVLSLLGWLLSN